MTIDLPPVPHAVVEFVQQNDKFDSIDYVGEWEDYTVFYISKYGKIKFGGYIDYLLYKDGKVREPNKEEYWSIFKKFDSHKEDEFDIPLGEDADFKLEDLTH